MKMVFIHKYKIYTYIHFKYNKLIIIKIDVVYTCDYFCSLQDLPGGDLKKNKKLNYYYIGSPGSHC